MMSTFHGIEVGKRGLQVHQQGMHVVEHNISNMNTEGYSRQQITFEAMNPLFIPGLTREHTPGQVGQGSTVASIRRKRDEFIDDRIIDEKSNQGYWDTMQFHLYQVEQIHNESSEHTVRQDLDNFWKGWQKLNQNPDDRATRAVVLETGGTLAKSINKTFDRLYELQQSVDSQVKLKIDEINAHARQIAELNERILQSENAGDNPNDLRDKRDVLVEKLTRLVNVNVVRTDADETTIYVGAQYLVQGAKYRTMLGDGTASKDGYVDVKWADDRSLVKLERGEISGLLTVRDKVLEDQITQLDNMTANLTDLVNETHRDGFGLNGKTGLEFFQSVRVTQNRNGNFDQNGDGVEDHTVLFKMAGTKKVDPEQEIGSSGRLNFGPRERGGKDVVIDYTARDKVKDVIDRVNRNDVGVVAYLNNRGRLSLKAAIPADKRNQKFAIRHVEDSGDLMVGVAGLLREKGPAGAFDWGRINEVAKLVGGEKDWSVTPQYHPARWVDVDLAIKNDLNNIAAAKGLDTNGDDKFDRTNGPGDGNNALAIASYRTSRAMIGENATFDQFFTAVVGRLGSDSRDAKTHYEKSLLVGGHLERNRKSVSGVSVDEEMAQMVMLQHGYNASARLIRTIDGMLDTVINRLHA